MKDNTSPYHPKHWPVWILMGLLWLLIQFPYRVQLKIGKYAGLFALKFAKRERFIAETNISRCFPDMMPSEKAYLLRESFIAMGIGMFETAFGWWGSEKRLKKLVHIEGLEYVTSVLKNNKGALVFTPHFSCLHMAGRLVNLFHPFAGMYFPPKNPVFRQISFRAMSKVFQLAIPRDDAKNLIRTLKKNIAVLYTPDTDAGPKNSIFVPFFNIQTATVTATARFSQITNCAVIPATYYRRSDNKGYGIKFYPPLSHYPSEDPYQDALIINQWVEKFVREHPEQYLWQYKRFKTRPVGETKFYIK